MGKLRALLVITALAASPGCVALESLGGSCTQEQLVLSWPVTTTRGGFVTSTLLTSTLTPGNLDKAQFDRLRQLLVEGGAGAGGLYNVVWTVPAFNVNGGYIAFSHHAPLTNGETRQVTSAFEGGGWGAQPVGAAFPAAISLRAENFTATSASGSINVIRAAPLGLRIDVTTTNATGETIRVVGDAGFAYQVVNALCT